MFVILWLLSPLQLILTSYLFRVDPFVYWFILLMAPLSELYTYRTTLSKSTLSWLPQHLYGKHMISASNFKTRLKCFRMSNEHSCMWIMKLRIYQSVEVHVLTRQAECWQQCSGASETKIDYTIIVFNACWIYQDSRFPIYHTSHISHLDLSLR